MLSTGSFWESCTLQAPMVYRYFATKLFSQRWLERMSMMKTEYIKDFWVDATAEDVARVMAGETVEARFRDSAIHLWMERLKLTGVIRGLDGKPRWIASTGSWVFCQVYREPSWHANKPDPGPGYRLLGKFPDEQPKPGDECFGVSGKWGPSCQAKDGGHQVFGIWYRRRIEPVEPKTVRLDEGSKCPVQGCSGALRVRPVKDCSCHIKPPCAHCEDNPPCCEACEWTAGDPIEPVEPEPKHYVLRVGDSCETPCGNRVTVMPQGSAQRFLNAKAGDTIKTIHGQTITITEKGFEVTQ
jgi:hypothetical protein